MNDVSSQELSIAEDDKVIDLDPKVAFRDAEPSDKKETRGLKTLLQDYNDLLKESSDLNHSEPKRDFLSSEWNAWRAKDKELRDRFSKNNEAIRERKTHIASTLVHEIWQPAPNTYESLPVKGEVADKKRQDLISEGVHPDWVTPKKSVIGDQEVADANVTMFRRVYQYDEDLTLSSTPTGSLMQEEGKTALEKWHRAQEMARREIDSLSGNLDFTRSPAERRNNNDEPYRNGNFIVAAHRQHVQQNWKP